MDQSPLLTPTDMEGMSVNIPVDAFGIPEDVPLNSLDMEVDAFSIPAEQLTLALAADIAYHLLDALCPLVNHCWENIKIKFSIFLYLFPPKRAQMQLQTLSDQIMGIIILMHVITVLCMHLYVCVPVAWSNICNIVYKLNMSWGDTPVVFS